MSWTSIRSNPPGVRRTAAFITTSLCVPRRPNRLASPDGRCRWRSCSRMPFLRLLMFRVFVFSWCFTPHFNPIELRFICGSPILSNHCLFVRTFKVGGHTRAHSSETEKSSFCSCLLLPPRVAHHVVREFPASPFDGDLAKMRAAGLVTEGVGQLIEGEAAVQDGTYPRLFERSDIVLLLAPAANHESLQARLLGHQSDGRHFTVQPGQHAN